MRSPEGIRIVSAHDTGLLPVVRELFKEYRQALDAHECFAEFEHEMVGLPGRYAPPTGCLLLAMAGTVAVGCAAMRPLEAGICEMKRLYVRPPYRRCGAGRRLAKTLIHEARIVGYTRMRLDTLPAMAEAIALYESLGFRHLARPTGSQNVGPIDMELVLR